MQLKHHMVTIEDLVPAEHFLRKLEAALDLSFVYEETAPLYSRKYGRPPIDPVVMVKYLLVGFLYGIPSEQQIERRCADSNAFRWYLGIDLDERVPDHSMISQLRRRIPPMTSRWPIGCWRNLALTFLLCLGPPMTVQKLNLSGMYTCVQMGKSCGANGCIVVGVGCFGSTGRTKKTAAAVLCGKSGGTI